MNRKLVQPNLVTLFALPSARALAGRRTQRSRSFLLTGPRCAFFVIGVLGSLAPAAWAQSLVPEGAVFTGNQHPPLEVVTYSGSVCHLVTFEGGAHLNQIHPETGGLVPGTPIRFGPEWFTITSGNYGNNPSIPTIAIYQIAPAEVTFEQPVARVSFFYASSYPVTLDAYNANGNLLSTDSAGANLQPDGFTLWEEMGVDLGSDLIKSVQITTASSGSTGIDDFTVCQEGILLIEAEIDLHPDNYPNETDPYNTNSNKPVDLGVLSSADFDATSIDVGTALLGDPSLDGTVPAQGYWTEDLDGDGILDLVINFGTARDFDEAAALDASSTLVRLTALTLDGDFVLGEDSITIVGQ